MKAGITPMQKLGFISARNFLDTIVRELLKIIYDDVMNFSTPKFTDLGSSSVQFGIVAQTWR